MHIIVVDDDVSVHHSLHRLIKSLGHTATVYGGSDEFFMNSNFGDALKEADCVLLDAQMPGLSGLDIQNAVTNLSATVPIIFITAHVDEELRSKALEKGAVGFLEKPFDDQALIALIEKAISSENVRNRRQYSD